MVTNEKLEDKVTIETTPEPSTIATWASGEKLRQIEKDVVIPNMMKKKARLICKEYVDSFAACIKGRTISMAWSCKEETEAMRKCLADELAKPGLFEECRSVYIEERKEFQDHYAETGEKKKMKRKESSIF